MEGRVSFPIPARVDVEYDLAFERTQTPEKRLPQNTVGVTMRTKRLTLVVGEPPVVTVSKPCA